MSLFRPSGPGPWRSNPHEHRRLVTVRHEPPGTYELTVRPGADADDLAQAAAALPDVVFTGHRPLAPADPAAVLTFRAEPAENASARARPSPRGGTPGWLPTIAAAAADLPPSAHEDALRAILASAAAHRHGWCLVCAIASCDPDAAVAAAEGIRAAGAGRAPSRPAPRHPGPGARVPAHPHRPSAPPHQPTCPSRRTGSAVGAGETRGRPEGRRRGLLRRPRGRRGRR
jgi:hypothetical protein